MDRTDAARSNQARSIISRFALSNSAVLIEQALWEFQNVVVRRRFTTRDRALALVENASHQIPVAYPPAQTVSATLSLMRTTNLRVWDARLLATCGACGVQVLLSEDMQDGAHYGPVRVLNPFNPANDQMIDALLT
jgi:predicted nucleic acid-binding protein